MPAAPLSSLPHRRSVLLATAAALAAAALAAVPASAATLTVTSTADGGAGSLRAAVAAAGNGDTINLPAGTITLTSSPISISQNVTIAGAGVDATTVSGGHAVQLFTSTAGASVTIHDLALVDGKAAGSGGAISSNGTLALTRVRLTGNSAAGDGGAISSGGPLTLTDVALAGNVAGYGGALTQEAPFTLDRVTMTGNAASSSDGAMYLSSVGVSTIRDTTIANNTSVAGYGGWEVSNSTPAAVITIQNSTIVGNQGGSSVGGFRVGSTQTAKLLNTIVAGNTTPTGPLNCYQGGSAHIISLGHNIADTASPVDDCNLTAAGDQPGVDPKLGPLGDHGGFGQTLLPLPGSPAIDHGDAASCPAVDGRGVARPLGGGCDVGAIELASPSAVTGAALNVTSASATLTGTVSPFGLGGTARFRLGPTAAYGTLTSWAPFAAAAGPAPISTTVTGLSPATTYHARLDVATIDGSASGADVTFTTAPAQSGGGGNGGKTAPPRCVVPALKGLTLPTVRSRLKKAHCKLGTVHKPRHVAKRARLVVSRQSPAKGRRLKAGAKVAVTLAVAPKHKPKPKR